MLQKQWDIQNKHQKVLGKVKIHFWKLWKEKEKAKFTFKDTGDSEKVETCLKKGREEREKTQNATRNAEYSEKAKIHLRKCWEKAKLTSESSKKRGKC